MSFVAITSGEITSGQPVASNTQVKIKDNFDDHEARIEVLEASISSFPAIILRVNGAYGVPGAMDRILKTMINIDMTIIGVRILIDQAGTSGVTEVDIKRKRGAGSYTSIFTTLPSVDYSIGDDALSSNAVLDPSFVDIQAGDILRLDTTSVQPDGVSFLIRIDYNRG